MTRTHRREARRDDRRLLAARALGAALLLAATIPAAAQDDAGGGAGGAGHGGPPPTAVRVGAVRQEALQERRRVTGELRAVERSRVATIEPGLVVEHPIDEGQIVKKGDVLAVLDQRRLEINLRRLEGEEKVADARLAARRAELELKQHDVESLKALEARRASNPKELADADSELRIAEARELEAERDVEVIRADADLLRTRIADMTIRAPFDGVVVQTFTEQGEWVAEGAALAEIVSTGAYEAWLDVPQALAEAVLTRRSPVQVRIDASGRSVPESVPSVVPLVDRTARSFSAFVRVEDPDGALAPGMSVTGWVPTDERKDYLTVPRNALLQNNVGFFVYAAQPRPGGPSVAAPVQVEVLFEAGDRFVVRANQLSAGDLVVVEGNERLFPMMPISFEPVAAAPAPAPAPAAEESASRPAASARAQKGDR